MRHVILHHHIFKNAGTSFDDALRRRFGDGLAMLHAPNADGVIDAEDLGAFLAAHPELCAVSSHHFHCQPFALRGFAFFHVALVRRPMDRFLSIYKFMRRSEGELAELARSSSIREFMRHLIERQPHMVENPQVNIFANHGFYGRPTNDADLERALKKCRDFSLCAPVERFDEAVAAFEYFNAPAFAAGGMDLAYQRQNKSEPWPSVHEMPELLGRGDFDWLCSINERDEALWRFASDELDRRIAAVPDFSRRLNSFRNRCDALAAPQAQELMRPAL